MDETSIPAIAAALLGGAVGWRYVFGNGREARAREMLEWVDLKDFADYYPADLSGGMKKSAGLARAIAAERGMSVEISEPDVSPMAIQGPKAADVVAHVCGDWVRDLKYFWFRETDIAGIPVVVQRSGWSRRAGRSRSRPAWNNRRARPAGACP